MCRKTLLILMIYLFAALAGSSGSQAQNRRPAFPDPSQPDFYQRYQAWVKSQEDDFFSSADEMFEEMEAFRREMLQRMQRNDELLRQSRPEDVYHLKSGPGITKIYQEEQGDNLLIHILIPGLEQGKYRVEVLPDRLNITGEVQQQQNAGNLQSYSFNQFQKSIPLPQGTDPNSVTYRTEPGKIVVVIPKDKIGPAKPSLPPAQDEPKTPLVI